jgi:outer membrane immunogenic protein
MPAPAFTWTGIYAGVNVGAGWSKHSTQLGGVTTVSDVVSGVIGGGQLGANWQVGGVVLGAEADIQGSSQRQKSTTSFPGFPAVSLTEDYSKPWFATFRGRVGWAFADGWLVYATGGGAWLDSQRTFTIGAGPFSLSSGFELSHIGWTAGAGLEGAINRNWSWKVEYLYMATGTFSSTVSLFGASGQWNSSIADNVVRAGINYRF